MDKAPISPRRILILDDQAGCREAWQLVCEELWPEASYVHAETLVEALRHPEVDLVLTDLSLPESAPRQTVQALVAVLPATVPLILLSGSVASFEGYEFLRLGADAFFLKGRDITELTQILYTTWVAHCGLRLRMAAMAGA